MNTLEKIINEILLSQNFFKDKLKDILVRVNSSMKKIKEKGQSEGFEYTEDVEKELLSKCLYENVNRVIYDEVKLRIIKEE